MVATRDGAEPLLVIAELKLGFSLELLLQGVDRIPACDEVWLAVKSARRGRVADPRVRKLCRLLGFGLLGIGARGRVDILVEPMPWRPRRNPKRRSALVEEHRRRIGDPVKGGGRGQPIMTAYRQQALICAAQLSQGPLPVRTVRETVPDAGKILLDNVYGWFARVERGVYALTDPGKKALQRWPQVS